MEKLKNIWTDEDKILLYRNHRISKSFFIPLNLFAKQSGALVFHTDH